MKPGSSLAKRRAASAALLYVKLVVSARSSECSWKSLCRRPARTPSVSGLKSATALVDHALEAEVELVAREARDLRRLALVASHREAIEVVLRHVARHVHAV